MASGNKICPYCQARIVENDHVFLCSVCNTPHHADCWSENIGCTSYGCQGNPLEDRALNASADQSPEKTKYPACSQCGKTNPVAARFCVFCGCTIPNAGLPVVASPSTSPTRPGFNSIPDMETSGRRLDNESLPSIVPDANFLLEYLPDIVQPGCPIEVKKYVLMKSKDTKEIYAQFETINTSKAAIKAFRIRVECFDSLGDSIDTGLPPIALTVQDILIPAQAEYHHKEWIQLANRRDTRQIRVVALKALDTEGQIWQTSDIPYQTVPIRSLPAKAKMEELQEIAGKDAIVFAGRDDRYWFCVCGKVNELSSNECFRCGRVQGEAVQNFTQENVTQEVQHRKAAAELALRQKQESDRLAEEKRLNEIRLAEEKRLEDVRLASEKRREQIRIEEEKRVEELRIKEKRRKEECLIEHEKRLAEQAARRELSFRRNRTISLLLTVTIIICAIVILYLVPLFKHNQDLALYAQANELVEKGDFTSACKIYAEIPEINDSKERFVKAYMESGYAELDNGYPSTANDIFENATSTGFEFSIYYAELLYMRGYCCFLQNKYDEAISFFLAYPNFYNARYDKNGATMANDVRLSAGQKYEADGNLIYAYKYYLGIDPKDDTLLLKIESVKKSFVDSTLDLKTKIEKATAAKSYDSAKAYLVAFKQLLDDYKTIFGDILTTADQYTLLERENNKGIYTDQYKALLKSYTDAMNSKLYISACSYVNLMNDVNNTMFSICGTNATPATELRKKFDAAAIKILLPQPKDTIDTAQVGGAYLKTGTDPNSGTRAKTFTHNNPFGLYWYNIYTYNDIHVEWYRREIPYFQTSVVETLVSEHLPVQWKYDTSWFAWFDKNDTRFTPGYYVAVLLGNSGLSDYIIGRFYFQIK
jgi:hypothetical protein